jgi:hypothetical protein
LHDLDLALPAIEMDELRVRKGFVHFLPNSNGGGQSKFSGANGHVRIGAAISRYKPADRMPEDPIESRVQLRDQYDMSGERGLSSINLRVGHILPLRADSGVVRVEADVTLRSDRNIIAGSASVYLANGLSTMGLTVERIGPEPKNYALTLENAQGMPLEFWLRLALDKGVLKPAGAEILMEVTLRRVE